MHTHVCAGFRGEQPWMQSRRSNSCPRSGEHCEPNLRRSAAHARQPGRRPPRRHDGSSRRFRRSAASRLRAWPRRTARLLGRWRPGVRTRGQRRMEQVALHPVRHDTCVARLQAHPLRMGPFKQRLCQRVEGRPRCTSCAACRTAAVQTRSAEPKLAEGSVVHDGTAALARKRLGAASALARDLHHLVGMLPSAQFPVACP